MPAAVFPRAVHTADADKKPLPEGKETREFYTQDEIREIVAYGKSGHVMAIPEIEMPGHSGLAVNTYPDKMRCVGESGSRHARGMPARLRQRRGTAARTPP